MRTTFKIARTQGSADAEGKVIRVFLAGRMHKFVAHGGHLSDYRTGRRFGDLESIKVERMARISTYTRTTDRQAARILVQRTVERLGIDKVTAELQRHPTLNT
jgi:hypothetical protein